MNMQFKSICVAMALVAAPLTAQAVPVTYDIGPGSAPGFSGSWIHAATDEMGNTGYFANGEKAGISGFLTLDMDNLAATDGLLTGVGDFGLNHDTWTIDITGGGSSALPTFLGGDSLLLSLDYNLTSAGGHSSTGTFYFANRDFNNNIADGGPNLIDDNNLYLWGNNWINANGAIDRITFINNGVPPSGPDGLGGLIPNPLNPNLNGTSTNFPLGLDLYGEVSTVPEPGVLAMLAMGIVGMGVRRRITRR